MNNIFQFELKQLFRDKKTIFFIFILPMLIMPLQGIFIMFTQDKEKSITEEKITILVQQDKFTETLEPAFKARKITPVYAESIPENLDSVKKIMEKHIAVIRISRPDSLATPVLTVQYVTTKDKQGIHSSRVISALNSLKDRMIKLRYQEINISNYWKSAEIVSINHADRIKTESREYAKMLPNSLILILLFGVFMLANYIILGEKDNKTLETILSTGVKRSTIIKGKFGVIISGGLIMSVLEFFSFYLYGKFAFLASYTIHFDFMQIFWFVCLSLFMAVFFAALAININCRMKSTSSANIIMLPLDILVFILVFAGSFDGITIERGLLLMPIVNFAGILKAVVMNDYAVSSLLIIIASTAFYSWILFKGAAKILSREDILERDTEDIDLLTANDKLGFALISFAVLAMFYLQLGGYLQSKNLAFGLSFSLIVIIGGASVLILKLAKEPLLAAYRFKRFNFSYLLLAVFLGLFARFPVSFIQESMNWFFPMPEISQSTAEMIDKGLAGISFPVLLLIVAVLPGIFEELLFRGAFLKLVERGRGIWKTSLIVGALFGAMHLNIFSFLETGLLGVLLTYITIASGSIFPAMIFHIINNGSSFILMEYSKGKGVSEMLEQWDKAYNLNMIITSITLVVLIIWLGKPFLNRKKSQP